MSITHITNRMVEDKPAFVESEVYTTLKALLPHHILVAHNARFDIAILKNEGLEVPQSICTFKMARFLDPNNEIPEYNLQFLRYYLDIDIEANAHDASGDVLVMEALFQRQLTKMIELYGDEEAAINKMIEVSSHPILFQKITFGKHRDKLLIDIVKEDRDYLLWLLNSKIMNNPEDEDWIYTLQYHLKIENR